jgi:hypothetical protein
MIHHRGTEATEVNTESFLIDAALSDLRASAVKKKLDG